MSHFDSQLQNCFVRDGKPEVPGLGVLSPEGRQDLHLGTIVPAVQEEGLRTQHEGLVSCDAGLVLLDVPREDKFYVLVQDSEGFASLRRCLSWSRFHGGNRSWSSSEADICFTKHFELIRVHCYFCSDDSFRVFSSTVSTTSSSRASVLEEYSVPAYSKDEILEKEGKSLSMRQIARQEFQCWKSIQFLRTQKMRSWKKKENPCQCGRLVRNLSY
jgi:hypothetical protein